MAPIRTSRRGMSAFGGKADVNHSPAEGPLLAKSGHSGDELSPYSTGVWIEFGLWLLNLFASVIVEFRVFVGLPVEILHFNLQLPGAPKGFQTSFGWGAARPSNRTARFVLVSAPPDAGNPRPGRCSTAPSVACVRTNRARRVEPRWLSGPLVPTASILAVVSSPNRGT